MDVFSVFLFEAHVFSVFLWYLTGVYLYRKI